MARWFNTAGPCEPEIHYMLPPERRLAGVRELIDQRAYFVVHAPRQSGKTTALISLAGALTREGRYAAVLLSLEVGQPFGADPGAAEAAVLATWRGMTEHWLPGPLRPPPWPDAPPGSRIAVALEAWSAVCPRPLVVFLDEVDALHDQALIAILRQLRGGFPQRPQHFPWSLALIGLRDVRDYKVASGGSPHLGTASPFNIKTASISLPDFTKDDVAELYAQHTTDTGQRFTERSIKRAFELTQGQPWLVNALARECVQALVPNRAQEVTEQHVEAAKRTLVERQDTHLDSLAERLREERVQRVIEPLLAGELPDSLPADDVRYAVDLGLVRRENGGIEIANPIYAEIIPTALAEVTRAFLPKQHPTWIAPDGSLDTKALLDAFLSFWRQHGEPLMRTSPYHEIAPHLVLMAFLHRVVNGGGTIDREYAVGSGRIDLLVTRGVQRLAIEIKVWRDGRPDPVAAGLAQLDAYLERLGLDSGWLVLFDRRSSAPPIEARTHADEAKTPGGRVALVVRG